MYFRQLLNCIFFKHKTTHRAVFSKRLRPITPTYKVIKEVLRCPEGLWTGRVGHVTVLDQWGGAVWDNRLSLAGWSARQWWRRKWSEEDGVLVGVQSEEQEVWHVRVDFNKVTEKRRSSVLSVKRGRYVGTRRFRVSGQRTPEVNKVALIALKYFNALIAATLIASINALTLTALIQTPQKTWAAMSKV